MNEFSSLYGKSVCDNTARKKHIISIAHRGAVPSSYPENTLPAFAKAAEMGFDYVEVDVRATSDGELVILHDTSINRTAVNTDGTAIASTVNIADITYAQALEYVFCGESTYDLYSDFPSITIPTFEETVKVCARCGIKIWIDMYVEPTSAVLGEMFGILDDYGMRDNVVWGSSTSNYVLSVKNYYGKASLAQRTSVFSDAATMIAYFVSNLNDGQNVVFGNVSKANMASYAPLLHQNGFMVLLSTESDLMDVWDSVDASICETDTPDGIVRDYFMTEYGRAAPTVYLNLNRTETNNSGQYLGENAETYCINPGKYDTMTVGTTACTVSDKTTNSVTVLCNEGGTGLSYPLWIDGDGVLGECYGTTLTLTWTATGTSNTRFRLKAFGNSNNKYATIDQTGTKSSCTIAISADGNTITVDGTAITSNGSPFVAIAFFFGAATNTSVSYSNVTLAKAA